MKYFGALLTLCLLLLSPLEISAQTRSRRTAPRRGRAQAAASSRGDSDAVALGRMKVAERIKLLSNFLYVYGGVANEIELTEAQARQGGSSSEMSGLADKSKAALRRSLRDVRDGLDLLEYEFRTTPGLQRHYERVAGVAAAASDAEDLAGSGRVKDAGRKLLQVVSQLADALAAM